MKVKELEKIVETIVKRKLNEVSDSSLLLLFRLYAKSYGPEGNPKTLAVVQRPDNTIGYSFYGGWQSSGMGFAISNLQLKKSLPVSIQNFKNVKELQKEIESVLATGVGSHYINKVEVLNDFKKSKSSIDDLKTSYLKLKPNQQKEFLLWIKQSGS